MKRYSPSASRGSNPRSCQRSHVNNVSPPVHSACIENPRETSAACICQPRSSTSRPAAWHRYIHFLGIFNRIPAWNSRDICLPTISFFILFPPSFEVHAKHTVGFSNFNSIFSLDHFSPSFTCVSTVPEQFWLFEQRREYYSADYARLFRLENPLCDFRRAGGSSYRQYFSLL